MPQTLTCHYLYTLLCVVRLKTKIMSCWTKPELENMLEDVVNELDLSEIMIEKHGPLGTAPAELVRLVLEQKDKEIRMLKAGMSGNRTDVVSHNFKGC